MDTQKVLPVVAAAVVAVVLVVSVVLVAISVIICVFSKNAMQMDMLYSV